MNVMHLKGKHAIVPLINRSISIIQDRYVWMLSLELVAWKWLLLTILNSYNLGINTI